MYRVHLSDVDPQTVIERRKPPFPEIRSLVIPGFPNPILLMGICYSEDPGRTQKKDPKGLFFICSLQFFIQLQSAVSSPVSITTVPSCVTVI